MSSDDGILDIELEELVREGINKPHSSTHHVSCIGNMDKYKLATIISIAVVVLLVVLLVVILIAWAYTGSLSTSSHDSGSTNTIDIDKKVLNELKNIVIPAMNRSVNPCEDFYQYACGGWISNNTLPPDKSVMGMSFTIIGDRNNEVVRDILEDGWPIISPFYQSCMNISIMNSLGNEPLIEYLDMVENITDTSDGNSIDITKLFQLIGSWHRYGLSAFFDLYIGPDLIDTSINVIYVTQGGLGLPGRNYYLEDDDASKALREEYKKHIKTMLSFTNYNNKMGDLQTLAENILKLETSLANASMTPAESRNPYNTKPKKGLDLQNWAKDASFGTIDIWNEYFSSLGFNSFSKDLKLNVAQVNFTKDMLKILSTTIQVEPATIRGYMWWHLVQGTAGMLSDKYRKESFEFTKKLYGIKAEPPRWKRCVGVTNSYLGFITGHHFIQKMFPADSKDIAHRMITNIEESFKERINENDWMDTETKHKAVEKLNDIANKVGYPDKWPQYEDISHPMSSNTYFKNIFSLRTTDSAKQINKIGEKVDRGEWDMYPSEVNAYYSPDTNQIVFPAGIMQPRFFNHTYLKAMNYGGMGSVIGHELTHGFDDEGSQYNGTGSLVNWWSSQTKEKFVDKTQCLSKFYSKYTVPDDPNLHVNGNLTLGENLADNGGLKMAYYALKKEEERYDDTAIEEVFELTRDQLFYVSYAQNWCSIASPAYLKYLMTTNPHAPGMFRVYGPLSNSPEFSEAFQCAVNDPMNPKDKCIVW